LKKKEAISSALVRNGYPPKFINKVLSQSQIQNPTNQDIQTTNCTALRSILAKTKPENETQDTKNCVYNIPCECGKKYSIGETGRPLNTRITEHKRNTKMGEIFKSKIAEHSWDEDRRI
jgi:hypothetical protein